jgi:hypothetical protein
MRKQKLYLFCVVFMTAIGLTACETFDKIREPKPLTGENVHVYNMADGQIEFRMKVTGLTSTLWVTTELVNNSSRNISYVAEELLQFVAKECVEGQDIDAPPGSQIVPNGRQLIRYTYRLLSEKKSSPMYEQCKNVPLKFKVSTVRLDNSDVAPITLTIAR